MNLFDKFYYFLFLSRNIKFYVSDNVTVDRNLTVNGNSNIVGSLKIGSWTIKEVNGDLQFIKDDAKYDNSDWWKMSDTGFLAMTSNGNFWVSRSIGRGLVADNLSGKQPIGNYVVYGNRNGTTIDLGDGFIFNNGSMGMSRGDIWFQQDSNGLVTAKDAWSKGRKVADQ